MKTIFVQVPHETQSPDTFFHAIFRKIALFIRKSQYSDFAKFKISDLYYRYCPNFYQCVSPCLKLVKKTNSKLFNAILGPSKNKRAYFSFFRLFLAFKCEVFKISLPSYH